MKLVLSYRFTGENPAELSHFLGKVCTTLRDNGHEVLFSLEKQTFYEEQKFTVEQIYNHFLEEMSTYDALLSVVRSDKPSKGMRLEADKAAALGMRRVLAVVEGVESEFRQEVKEVIEYKSIDDLCSKLRYLS